MRLSQRQSVRSHILCKCARCKGDVCRWQSVNMITFIIIIYKRHDTMWKFAFLLTRNNLKIDFYFVTMEE